jgi:hypothetical protein
MATKTLDLTPDELVGVLDALDVPFLAGGVPSATVSPAELLKGLANAPEARLRAAIIPLLLRHPEFATGASVAASALTGTARWTLELFYTAAALLQRKYAARLYAQFGAQPALPDLFRAELRLGPSADVESALRRLGERHTALVGLTANWVGTYEHTAECFIEYVERRARWTTPMQRRAA